MHPSPKALQPTSRPPPKVNELELGRGQPVSDERLSQEVTAPIPAASILELPGACATFYEEAFARYEELRRKRVERIIAAAARTTSARPPGSSHG